MIKLIHHITKILKPVPTDKLIKLTGHQVIFPFYHAVSDIEQPHLKHTYPVRTIENFESDLQFLTKYFTPLSYKDVIDINNKHLKLSKPGFMLSFDDGLSSYYYHAVPILKKMKIPCVNFINSAFIDNKDLFYRYKASLLAEYIKKAGETVRKKVATILSLEKTDTDNICHKLLMVQYKERAVLDEIAILSGCDFQSFLEIEKPYLTTEQINEISQQGFHTGSHSIDHPLFSDLNLEEQINQTLKSLEILRSLVNVENLFSFPFTDYGVGKTFFKTLSSTTSNELITFGTAGLKREKISMHFQRIPVEIENYSIEEILRYEAAYYFIKAFIFRNTIHRK